MLESLSNKSTTELKAELHKLEEKIRRREAEDLALYMDEVVAATEKFFGGEGFGAKRLDAQDVTGNCSVHVDTSVYVHVNALRAELKKRANNV